MVTEEDLIRTVVTAYTNGWRQVKLYFMCGLPTETDDDVLPIADLAAQVIATGRQASGRRDIRCTVSIGGFVPKPHTPFQWAAQDDHETIDRRLLKLRGRDPQRPPVRPGDRLPLPRRQARRRSKACSPVATAGSARSSSRSGATAAGSTAGASTSRTSAGRGGGGGAGRNRRRSRLVHRPVSVTSTRSCRGTTSTPAWTRSGSGRTGRTRWTSSSRTTAGGRRASTAASARSWAPRSRSARPDARCCRSQASPTVLEPTPPAFLHISDKSAHLTKCAGFSKVCSCIAANRLGPGDRLPRLRP